MYQKEYSEVFLGDKRWQGLKVPEGNLYAWETDSTYIKQPPFFENMPKTPAALTDIKGARVLAILGHSVTTDHISPAGAIKKTSPAGAYLLQNGVFHEDFNSYGSRRGNDRVMTRGTFANVRIKNLMVPGVEGGVTKHQPDGTVMPIYDASIKYQSSGVPLVIFAGQEYGTGSSRDWAAKGTRLLGVKAVVAQSFERIHRSNLCGMGLVPLQFPEGVNAASLKLDGTETFDILGLSDDIVPMSDVTLVIHRADGTEQKLTVKSRIDTAIEVEYVRHGGILPFVLRQLLGA
jgi:aconitate hydratase